MPGVNPITGRPGPASKPLRDGDRKQARQRINVEVRTGRRVHPNSISCADCGHCWAEGERRHEYDHHLGYAAEHHGDVEAVCTTCHARRRHEADTHCNRGHEWTDENTIRRSSGRRACRECTRARDRKRRDAAYWRRYRADRKERDDG